MRLLTFLSPSIPLSLYEAIGDYLAARLDVEVSVHSETARSGPGPGTPDPFRQGDADVGFVCAPSWAWMAGQPDPAVVLAGVAPVHTDPRNEGRPVYFSELVVAPDNPAQSLEELVGQRFAFNDESSLSGYHCVRGELRRIGQTIASFSEVLQSGSHLRSLEMIARGEVDVAAIDANALGFARAAGVDPGFRVVETLGPYPVQPVVFRSEMDQAMQSAIREALLEMHFASGGAPLRRHGVEHFVRVDEEHYAGMEDLRDA